MLEVVRLKRVTINLQSPQQINHGKEPDNMDIFFTIETDLDNVRKDLLERLRRKIPPVLR
jgi:hypothetical protein